MRGCVNLVLFSSKQTSKHAFLLILETTLHIALLLWHKTWQCVLLFENFAALLKLPALIWPLEQQNQREARVKLWLSHRNRNSKIWRHLWAERRVWNPRFRESILIATAAAAPLVECNTNKERGWQIVTLALLLSESETGWKWGA